MTERLSAHCLESLLAPVLAPSLSQDASLACPYSVPCLECLFVSVLVLPPRLERPIVSVHIPPIGQDASLSPSLPRPMTRMSLYGFAFQPCRACANQPQSRVKKIKPFLHPSQNCRISYAATTCTSREAESLSSPRSRSMCKLLQVYCQPCKTRSAFFPFKCKSFSCLPPSKRELSAASFISRRPLANCPQPSLSPFAALPQTVRQKICNFIKKVRKIEKKHLTFSLFFGSIYKR